MPKDELAIAYDEGKVIGILQNTGGITECLDEIIEVVMSALKICRDCRAEALESSAWSCHLCGGVLEPPLRKSGILASVQEIIELGKTHPIYAVIFLLLAMAAIPYALGVAYFYFGFNEIEGIAGPVVATLALSLVLARVYYKHRKEQ